MSYRLQRQICCYPRRALVAAEIRQQDLAAATCCRRRQAGASEHHRLPSQTDGSRAVHIKHTMAT